MSETVSSANAEVKHGRDILTTGQIGKAFGVSPRTVGKWIDRGELPGFYLPTTVRGSKKGQDRRVYKDVAIAFAVKAGIRIPPWMLPLAAAPVAVSVTVPVPLKVVSPARVSLMAARGELSAVVIGCGDGLAAAIDTASAILEACKGLPLLLILSDDRDPTSVPIGLFSKIVSESAAGGGAVAKWIGGGAE
jgi:hypothetical protein